MNSTYFLYISILICAASFGYIAERGNDQSLRVSARFLVFLSMAIPAVLRYNIGTDYPNYVKIYVSKFTVFQEMEPGFKLIGLLCNAIDMPPWLFIGVISGMTYGLICFVIPRKHFFTVILFYILSFSYLYSYSGIRQLLASSFLYCGFSFYYYDNKLKGWICFIASALIHYSSLIVFPIIIFSHIKLNRALRIIALLTVAIIFIFTDVAATIVNVFVQISPRYGAYLKIINQKPTTINTGLSLVIFALPSILLLLNSKNIERQSNGNILLNFNAAYIITILMVFIATIFGRVYMVLLTVSIFSIQIVYDSNRKYRTMNHYFLLSIFLAVFIRYITSKTTSAGFVPYNSIFNK